MPRVYKSPCYCINTRRSANALKEYYYNAFKNVGLTGSQYYLLTGLMELEKAEPIFMFMDEYEALTEKVKERIAQFQNGAQSTQK